MSPTPTTLPDYRKILHSEYLRRHQKNSAYSLKSFAADLGLSRPFLSLLFGARAHLSPVRAREVAAKLKMKSADKTRFLNLVAASSSRYKPLRENALNKFLTKEKRRPFDVEMLERLGWRHFALLELTKKQGFSGETKDFEGYFGFTGHALEEALELLRACGFLECVRGKWAAARVDNEVVSAVPHAAVQRFHLDLLHEAASALKTPEVTARQFNSLVFAFDTKRLTEVRQFVLEFAQNFDRRFSSGDIDAVYCLATHLFPLGNQGA